MPLSPQKVLDFQQAFKQVQIYAGLGVTEHNIDKVQTLVEHLNDIAIELYYSVYPRDELIEEKIAPEPKLHSKMKK